MQDMLNEIYKQRQNYIIIGLTGRIGSGCTTAASILSKNKHELSMPELSIMKPPTMIIEKNTS